MKNPQLPSICYFSCTPGTILRRTMALCSLSGLFGTILLLSVSFSFHEELQRNGDVAYRYDERERGKTQWEANSAHSVRKFTRVAMSSNDYDARLHKEISRSNGSSLVFSSFQGKSISESVNTSALLNSVGIVPQNFPQYHSVFLLVTVCSHPERLEYRQAIRETWGSTRGQEFQVLFLVGKHDDPYWNSLMEKENSLHGDILQVDVIDSYRNLSLKVIGGLCWLGEALQTADYIMKTDDDVYINVWYLLRLLKENIIDGQQILGALSIKSPVKRDLRDPWGVKYSEFAPKIYPPYVSGGAYVMSRNAVQKLCIQKGTRKSPFVHLEDVYVTGILAQATGIGHVAHSGFSFWTSKKAKATDIANNKRVSSVNMTPNQIYKLHWQANALLVSTTSLLSGKTIER